MARVTHFSIQADDLDRAEAFYRDLLGWEFAVWEGPEPIRMIRTGPPDEPGIDGMLVQRRGAAALGPPTAYVCSVNVPDDPESYVHRVRGLGGDVVTPRTAIPGVGWIATLKDSEGNLFDVMRRDGDAR